MRATRVVSHDDEEFTAFAAAIWPRLVRAAYLTGCSREGAEDAAQTVLERAYVKWPKVARASTPDGYVFAILFRMLRRSRQRRWTDEHPTADPGASAEPAGAPDHATAIATRLDIRHALSLLPHDQRTVLVLRFLEDLSENQVADALDVPPGTVKSRTARGLDRLRTQLHEPNPTTPPLRGDT